MAAAHLKTQNNNPSQSKPPKRRKHRETTISASASATDQPIPEPTHRKREPPAVATDGAWCCAARPSVDPSPPPQRRPNTTLTSEQLQDLPENAKPAGDILRTGDVSALIKQGFIPDNNASSPIRVRVSPGRVSPVMDSAFAPSYPSSYIKFNTALNAGLLNPLSPPPPLDKTRSSPTLFEMMANEQECHPRNQIPATVHVQLAGKQPITVQDKQMLLQERVAEILGSCSPGNQFNDATSSDVKLTLSSKDGFSVSMNLHRQILVAHSRFFADKLSDRWSKQQRSLPHLVEISDCDDVEIYMDTLKLMYCKDLRRKLMKEDVNKVLGILKVSAAIDFDAGVLSCLEYLEAAPWAEDEEEKVASLLSELQLESVGAGEVLKRVSVEVSAMEEGCEEIISKLLGVVLEGKDEKARKEMKGLVSKMLRENAAQNSTSLSDLSKDSLYSACNGCLKLLHHHFFQAAMSDFSDTHHASEERGITVGQISRQADNLHWILDILIDRQIADEFAKTWANQGELAELHSRVPTMYRFEVSRLTARFCVGIGKGQILISKEVRCLLLETWLEPFYDDFGWMRRACKGLDRNLVEEGLSQTILTLPLSQQQAVLLNWFDRFLNSGDDCPNIQRAFEVWWRRAFWKRSSEEGPHQRLQTTSVCDN